MSEQLRELREAGVTGPSAAVALRHNMALKVFRLSRRISRKVADVGEIADYFNWTVDRFGDPRPLKAREQLWDLMATRTDGKAARGFEFGVAWGYATGWWLERLQDSRVRWDGFDRFTGLPRTWRNHAEGAFDAGGQTPVIDDQRVTWHVGDVEDRLGDVDLQRTDEEPFIVLFDLDIFEPSEVVWRHIRPFLRPGDLLYFDEAYDRDERHLLDHLVLPAGRYQLIGTTSMALAIQVQEIYAD